MRRASQRVDADWQVFGSSGGVTYNYVDGSALESLLKVSNSVSHMAELSEDKKLIEEFQSSLKLNNIFQNLHSTELLKNGYEKYVADKIGAKLDKQQHYDCIWKDRLFLELKKGKTHVWLDLCRYADNLEKFDNNFTMFLFYNKEKMTNILVVSTKRLIEYLNLSRWKAVLMELKSESLHKSLNAQVRLTKKDLAGIREFEISNTAV